jgi:hypothetical protein
MSKIKPNHYDSNNSDVIRFCLDNNLDFCEGNIVKYVRRWREKNGIEDLYKAQEYLQRLIDYESNKPRQYHKLASEKDSIRDIDYSELRRKFYEEETTND